ncbi:MAG: SDR family oxidoreductase, partial [Chloroflexi bacterium]|nr:SDR family oxidoreductase [Chloroflexota bacterium]
YKNYAPYFAAKGGVVALTKVMAKELAPTVLVNAIAPGPILLPEDFTPEMIRGVERATLVKRIGNPEDIAQTALYLIEGTDFVTGAVITVDGGRQVV